MSRRAKPAKRNGSAATTTGATGGRGLVIAAGAAVAILIACGVGYRIVAGYLGRDSDLVRLPADALAGVPMKIGDWAGRDVPMDEALIKATAADAVLNRGYAHSGGAVGLFIAAGVRARDLMPHRPSVCYPGNGWTLMDSRPLDLALGGGGKLECTVYDFSRAGLEDQRITVLNYYIVDGRYAADESVLRWKASRGQGGIRYVAQVQVTCSGIASGEPAVRHAAVRGFAAESAAAIRAVMPDKPAAPPADVERAPSSRPGGGS